MIRKLSYKKKILLLGWLIYIGFLISKKYGIIYPSLIQNYFSDLLALPLTLGLALWLLRIYTRNSSYKLSLLKVFVVFVYFSVVFEWYLPQKSNIYTSDIWDVMAYFLGGFLYWFAQES